MHVLTVVIDSPKYSQAMQVKNQIRPCVSEPFSNDQMMALFSIKRNVCRSGSFDSLVEPLRLLSHLKHRYISVGTVSCFLTNAETV